MNRENPYDIHKYNEIEIPKELDAAVKKGLAMGNELCDKKRKKKNMVKWAGIAAAAAVTCSIVVSNPVLAAKIPIIGHIFERLQDDYSYQGDYSMVATPLQEEASVYTKESAGVTVSFSEVYCNDQAIYLALSIKSEEGFPDTFTDENGNMQIGLETKENYSFNPAQQRELRYLEGKMIDENTYAGILRISFDSGITIDDTEFNKYIEEAGGADAFKEITDLEIPENLRKEVDVPKSFTLNLSISQIIGDKAEPEYPYDKTEKELEAMSDEEWQEYMLQNTPEDYYDFPNRYENYWFDGSWDFEFPIHVDNTRTQVQEVNTTNEKGVGIASVEKTPFEIKLNEIYPDSGVDYFPVALDANGEILPYGIESSVNMYAIQDRDVSKIYVYICNWDEYMDEIKGYYYSDDYEQKKAEKSFKELLDERAVYKTEVNFE